MFKFQIYYYCQKKTLLMTYFDRLKNKLKIKKIESKQPIKAWIFVLMLNLLGFAGYLYLKINNIQLNS